MRFFYQSVPGKSVRYKEVFAIERFSMRFFINPFPGKVSVIRRCSL